MKYFISAIFTFSLIACTAVEQSLNDKAASELAENIQPNIPPKGEIYLNQIGFETTGPKIAILQSASETPLIWSLLNDQGQSILEGKTEPLGVSPQAGQALHKIDFSNFVTDGDAFKLKIEDSLSPQFKIGAHLYKQMKYDALSYYYHNRAKDPIKAEFVGAAHARPAGHPDEIATCFSGTDEWGTNWSGCDYSLDVSGGWYDAGDHGKYVVNSGISVWTLLNSYEHFKTAFTDGAAQIPEAGNKINDLLDEARENIEFMLAMQIPGDTILDTAAPGLQADNAPLSTQRINASGLVHHKVHANDWPGDGVLPHEFKQDRFLYPPSTGATLNLAAIGAYCARLWRGIDDDFANRCLNAAQKAWSAAQANPDIYAYGNFNGGGPYEDISYNDEFYWAAEELWLTTREAPYEIAAKKYKAKTLELTHASQPSFNDTALLGHLSAQNRQNILRAAELILADMPKEPFNIPYYKKSYRWGSNSELANRGVILGHAYRLTGDQKYRNAVVHLMDYLLGRNPLGQSYISGYGTRQYFNPHHRHWAPSKRKDAPHVPPGVLSGGPNNDNMSDPIAKHQIGKCAAQTCWTDHYKAWTQNEITINWNAPLVWMSSFLDASAEPR